MNIFKFHTVTSTNTIAKNIIRDQKSHDNFLVISELQSNGRGQGSHKFFSPKDTGLYMSAVLRLHNTWELTHITKLSAVAVCNVLEKDYDISADLKYVNDILVSGKKVGGILTESIANFDTPNPFVIIGVGLNLYAPKNGFPCDIIGSASYLFQEPINKYELAKKIANQILAMCENMEVSYIEEQYNSRLLQKA